MPSFIVLFLGISLVSYLVQLNLKKKFEKYSQVPVALSGKEVAEKMLRDNGIFDVKVVSTSGYLTDHYHPVEKTVNLSEDVYNGRSVAAAAVAAHECGHAVQHATAYSFLQMRSALVPVVSFASNYVSWVLRVAYRCVSASSANRHLAVCRDNAFQPRDSACGGGCEHACSGLAGACRYHLWRDAFAG